MADEHEIYKYGIEVRDSSGVVVYNGAYRGWNLLDVIRVSGEFHEGYQPQYELDQGILHKAGFKRYYGYQDMDMKAYAIGESGNSWGLGHKTKVLTDIDYKVLTWTTVRNKMWDTYLEHPFGNSWGDNPPEDLHPPVSTILVWVR